MKISIIQLAVVVGLFVLICQAYEIKELKSQVIYLKEGYDDMDRSLDCVIAWKGQIKQTGFNSKACLLPNGVWEEIDRNK